MLIVFFPQNICWLIGSFAVFYYTDFYRAVLYDRRIMRFVSTKYQLSGECKRVTSAF